MPIRTKSEIGLNIRLNREREHMTLRELADRMSDISGDLYSGNQISKWERGLHEPTLRDAGILSDALGCSLIAFLIGDDDNGNAPDWLSDVERQIMLYGVTKWSGNIHPTIHLMNLYMHLPPDRRAEVVNGCLWEFDQAQRHGELLPTSVPVDRDLITEYAQKL